MQPRENNQRPISRQSYSGYRQPSTDGIAPIPPRPMQQAPAPQPAIHQPAPIERPQVQPEALKPVWDTAPVKPLIPTNPSVTQEAPSFKAPTPTPVIQQVEPPQVTKPPKTKRKISLKKPLKILGGVAGTLLIGGAIFYFLAPLIVPADPAILLRDGLKNNMSLKQIQINTNSGENSQKSVIDIAQPKDPVVSSDFTFNQAGGIFGVNIYGTNDSTYFSYNKLPDSVSAITAKQVLGKWIQIRKDGKLDADTSHFLTGLSDPKTQIFGPILFGNYDEKTAEQLVDFLVSHNVYKLQPQEPAKATIDGQKAVVLPISLDVGYLKVAMQSAALSLGYRPNDIADAVQSMDFYKGAKGDLYISQREHKILRLVLTSNTGNKAEINYSNFDKATTSAQPSGAIAWSKFAPVEWQIEAQTYSKVIPARIDSARKGALDLLHTNLASYKAQKGYYPSFIAMNNLSWLTNIALGAPEIQKDPLAINLSLVAAPAPNVYAYIPTPANCDNTTVPCSHYQLVTTLSDAKQYMVQDP